MEPPMPGRNAQLKSGPELILEGPENKHPQAQYQDIATRRSHFVINPQWISEDFNKPQFESRTHRPWAYEFPGARRYATSGSGVPIPDRNSSAAAIVSAQREKKLPKQYVFY